MPDDDLSLLRDYARHNSEDAFTSLVSQHINLVYSVALRQTRDPHLAEEIVQAVFIILARKAGSLSAKTILPGWLCRTARYVSANALKQERRRQQREHLAYMEADLNEPESTTWLHIAPLIDGAMNELGQKDHDALVLRFFENRNFKDVGAALGSSEDAAKMRVNRALEKLRTLFAKRGVKSTVAILTTAISANSVQAAPPTLAKTAASAAFAKGATASGSTLSLIKETLELMAWTKIKMTLVTGVALLLAAGTATVVVKTVAAEKPVKLETRTFYIDSDRFISNVLAQAGETMNSPSVGWNTVLFDLLKFQGVTTNEGSVLVTATNQRNKNNSTGKITVRNTPAAMKLIEQTILELSDSNGPGKCDYYSRIPHRQDLGFNAFFYRLSQSEFERLKTQLNMNRTEKVLKPSEFQNAKQILASSKFPPFSSPRIKTGYTATCSLSVGDAGTNVQFNCLPMVLTRTPDNESAIDVKMELHTTGYFSDAAYGDWPDVDSRTNCAMFREVNIPNHGGFFLHTKNFSGEELVVLVEAMITK